MGVAGTDIQLSPAARKLFPYDVECKNSEKLNIWASIEQCENNTNNGNNSLIVFSKNHKPTYICITLKHFMELLKNQK